MRVPGVRVYEPFDAIRVSGDLPFSDGLIEVEDKRDGRVYQTFATALRYAIKDKRDDYLIAIGQWTLIHNPNIELPFPKEPNAEEAERLKRNALKAVSDSEESWIERALRIVFTICEHCGTFTTDSVWAQLGTDLPGEPRAMGAVMRKAKQNGWVRATGRYEPSEISSCHRRPIMVWKSLL